jgi:hypothetical protein
MALLQMHEIAFKRLKTGWLCLVGEFGTPIALMCTDASYRFETQEPRPS